MSDLESLKSIFKDRIFKIPDYQRGYAWTVKQLEDFWDDIVHLPADKYHYTGLLSLKKVEKAVWSNWNDERWLLEERGYTPFHVVDGQQRLTTVIIFIQAISELLRTIPENKDKKDEEIYLGSFSLKAIKEEYLVVQKPPQSIINTYKFSYEVDNPSFRFLKHGIFNEPDSGTLEETFYTLNLENAKNFFTENLKNHFDSHGLAQIEVLFKKLTQNFKFNLYEISDDFDVYVAFETMNNRGKKLSNLELLKNRLIYLTTLYDDTQLPPDDKLALREKINDAWKEIYSQLGRNKKNPLSDDEFLRAHWIMFFQYSRKKGSDYIEFLLGDKFTPLNIYDKTEVKLSSIKEFEEVVEGGEEVHEDPAENVGDKAEVIMLPMLTPKEIEDYVNSLKSAAVHWYNTHNPLNNQGLTSEESLWLDRLNRIKINYFRPLVTASFLSGKIDSKKRVELFKAIEQFIFIAFRLGRAMANYRSSEFFNAARELRVQELSCDELISKLKDRIKSDFLDTSENSEMPYFYSYFYNHLESKFKNGGGYYQWSDLNYFLYEYEMEKVNQRGSQKIDWKLFVKSEQDKVSIEHIYPQTPDNDYWKEKFKGVKRGDLKYYQGTLGNLLPLSQSINSSLQNDSFEEKKNPKYDAVDTNKKIRQGYQDGSHSEIEVANYTDWNPDTILDRGLKLLEFMERRWDIKFGDRDSKIKMLFLEHDAK